MIALSALASDVLTAYPGLTVSGSNYEGFVIEGMVRLDAERDGRDRLVQDFPLRIVVSPRYPIEVPSVFVLDDSLLAGYEHLMVDGSLCLGALGEIALFLQAESTLLRFMDEIVIGNLYAIEYNRIFGCLPSGERTHGANGLIEAYLELFEVSDSQAVFNILKCINDKSYRGHVECPCGSGMIGRRCHGPLMLEIMNGSSWYAVSADYERIFEALREAQRVIRVSQQRRNMLEAIAKDSVLKLQG